MLILVHLEIVLISTPDRCTVCTKRTIRLKSFCTHPMELLDGMAYVESCFGPFRDDVSFEARWEHGLHQTYDRLKNGFARTQWYS
jgi:hypothetical protein